MIGVARSFVGVSFFDDFTDRSEIASTIHINPLHLLAFTCIDLFTCAVSVRSIACVGSIHLSSITADERFPLAIMYRVLNTAIAYYNQPSRVLHQVVSAASSYVMRS